MYHIDFLCSNGWNLVKEAALTTIHKRYNGGEISKNWKLKILKTKHSPIRELTITYRISDLPRWIADQLSRHHVGVTPYMATSRTDRGNKSRNEQTMEEPTDLMQSHNAQSFISMCNSRLCYGCVSAETRELVEQLVKEVEKIEPEVAFYCVPNCILYGACKENDFTSCSHFKKFIKYILVEKDYDIAKVITILMDVNYRYQMYHSFKK